MKPVRDATNLDFGALLSGSSTFFMCQGFNAHSLRLPQKKINRVKLQAEEPQWVKLPVATPDEACLPFLFFCFLLVLVESIKTTG